eukprot:CAMPEP_0203914516 /NCGR_PEP_ID=MMETSP0359-20131031/55395_1 /ASSEMBLY_ACC=CAM_ASM_000338 /TAXON_ID=268821 /ORGANISM="Scrippsiella Hangoei, Strain SHTV-5" /LENGTH=560 /DNA_ID=CAMNT_0050840845 /DNA_START=121 /DNA_END=1800 /DNA_ORIENTATION=+
MVILAVAAAAASTGTFSWNREGFFFQKELEQKRDYQAQYMQIRQFELYREDIRDLVQLTVRKMDNYLLVNTLQLGFCVTLFTDGRPKPEEHDPELTWLIGVYAMCNGGAFLYYFLSMWLAMHASISAHSFGVRILTQCVRLPLPSKAQLDSSAARATDFENLNFSDVLRIPLWRQQLDNLNRAMNEASTDENDGAFGEYTVSEPSDEPSLASNHPVTKLAHVQLFRQLQSNWQAYDAYARVCMAMGTNQVLQALSYECLILLMAENDDVWPSLVCVALFTTAAWIIAKLDLFLSRRILFTSAVLMILPPICASISLMLQKQKWPFDKDNSKTRTAHNALVPAVYALHVLWIWFTTRVARATEYGGVRLPNNFRSVLYLDVFNWLNEQETAGAAVNTTDTAPSGQQVPHQQEVPAFLQHALLPECRQRKLELQADLARWEAPKVQEWLHEESWSLAEIRKLHTAFDAAVGELDSFGGGQASSSSGPAIRGSEAPSVWLRLEYNPGELYIYWYCCETGEVKWEVPEGRISDVSSLSFSVAEFGNKVSALTGRAIPEPQASPH